MNVLVKIISVGAFKTVNGRMFSLWLAYVDIVMLCSIFLAMSLDFATLTSVKKVRNLQHENRPIKDINFPTKNSKSPDLGSRMYHMYAYAVNQYTVFIPLPVINNQ